MMEVKPDLVTASRIVSEDPFMLHGLVVTASADGGTVTLYDGTAADAEKSLGGFKALAGQSQPFAFSPGLPLRRGLYVAIGANVTSALVLGHQLAEPSS